MFLGLSGVSIGYFFAEWTERHLYDYAGTSSFCNALMRRFGRIKRNGSNNQKIGKTAWVVISVATVGTLGLIVLVAVMWPDTDAVVTTTTMTTTTTMPSTESSSTLSTNDEACYSGHDDKATHIFEMNGQCYYIGPTCQKYGAALASCKDEFGSDSHLAEPTNIVENNEIYEKAIGLVPGKTFWIGINDMKSEGSWTYKSSNLEIHFQNWNAKDPSNAPAEDCVVVDKFGLWNDVTCHQCRGYICQYNLTSTPHGTEKPDDPELEDCHKPSWVGDGFCDDSTNNAYCQLDGGDCCLPEPMTEFCTICACSDTCEDSGGILAWIGDGGCDDDNNIPQCNYDGGDCCLDEVDTAYCSVCECIQN